MINRSALINTTAFLFLFLSYPMLALMLPHVVSLSYPVLTLMLFNVCFRPDLLLLDGKF